MYCGPMTFSCNAIAKKNFTHQKIVLYVLQQMEQNFDSGFVFGTTKIKNNNPLGSAHVLVILMNVPK